MNEREFKIHFARINLAEARRRRDHPANKKFYWFLIASAQKARREAQSIRVLPVQTGLFP